jgi:pyruvate/2-oxoglutarate dehydrogenase complex dihydrolipoamide acyltransferase (E2) component
MTDPFACPKITRREVLALGAAAGATAALGVPSSALATPSGVVGEPTPSYLRRSTYARLVGDAFVLGSHVLTLVHVGDVQGAQEDASMRDRDDAFDLEFTGQALPLQTGIHELSHELIGPFPLFIGPVGRASGGVQTYGVTVDRSVRIKLSRAPTAPQAAASAPTAVGGDEEHGGEPTPRDAAIVEQRRVELAAPAVKRRLRERRARHALRRTHANRIRFKRQQQARMRRARGSWVKRHFG